MGFTNKTLPVANSVWSTKNECNFADKECFATVLIGKFSIKIIFSSFFFQCPVTCGIY